jgi:hypothetical protein
MAARPAAVGVIAAGLVALLAAASLAAVTMHGTFTTPTQQAAISYTAKRAFHGGTERTFTVAGKKRPGSMYAAVGGGTGFVWYYGVSGIMAGNGLVTLQPDGTYTGPIWFFDKKGRTTDSGTMTVTFP